MAKIILRWEDWNDSETGFRVYRSTSTINLSDLPEPIAILPPNSKMFEDTSIESDVKYFYRVGAVFPDTHIYVSDEVSGSARVGDPLFANVQYLLNLVNSGTAVRDVVAAYPDGDPYDPGPVGYPHIDAGSQWQEGGLTFWDDVGFISKAKVLSNIIGLPRGETPLEVNSGLTPGATQVFAGKPSFAVDPVFTSDCPVQRHIGSPENPGPTFSDVGAIFSMLQLPHFGAPTPGGSYGDGRCLEFFLVPDVIKPCALVVGCWEGKVAPAWQVFGIDTSVTNAETMQFQGTPPGDLTLDFLPTGYRFGVPQFAVSVTAAGRILAAIPTPWPSPEKSYSWVVNSQQALTTPAARSGLSSTVLQAGQRTHIAIELDRVGASGKEMVVYVNGVAEIVLPWEGIPNHKMASREDVSLFGAPDQQRLILKRFQAPKNGGTHPRIMVEKTGQTLFANAGDVWGSKYYAFAGGLVDPGEGISAPWIASFARFSGAVGGLRATAGVVRYPSDFSAPSTPFPLGP